MKCEWCGKDYPEELESGEIYYRLQVYDKVHVICDDCWIRLKPIPSIFKTSQGELMKTKKSEVPLWTAILKGPCGKWVYRIIAINLRRNYEREIQVRERLGI